MSAGGLTQGDGHDLRNHLYWEVIMKLKALVLVLSMAAFASTSFAQFFPARAYVTVTPNVVTAQVYNPHYQPIFCSGRAIGVTAFGVPLFSYFNSVIPGGQYRFAYVYSTVYGDPLINGWSEIYCRF
jgi:hypothetical protein